MHLIPPISYQGGKQRIAKQIIDFIPKDGTFCDMCCGSGAISIEMVNRGKPPNEIFMVDQSPWGDFWAHVGWGLFKMEKLRGYINQIPSVQNIQGYIKELSKLPSNVDTPYVFLLLQAASFGGKAIWIKDNKWQNCSFRNYWEPTETSNRRSPVNPMMPMPNTLYDRVGRICDRMKGVDAHQGNVEYLVPSESYDYVVYIDPPYNETTSYGYNFDLYKWIKKCQVTCYVSEGRPLNGCTEAYQISSGQKKGGISGERKKAHEEWLSVFRKGEIKNEKVPTLFG